MPPLPSPLPIDDALPALRAALAAHPAAVLEAPPGAGKTTRVPLALLDAPWLAGRSIVMLEPRRLAARAAARWMARQLGEEAGGTVGYRVRRDARVGPRTRVEVVTEGILARMLAGDPALEAVGLVIFDEFHERSLQADLGLALTLESQGVLRPDLRVLVMSATLDGAPVARLLGDAPVVTSAGRSFPVGIRYAPRRPEPRQLEAAVAATIREALAADPGDLLAFLPGAREIQRTRERLEDGGVDALVVPLHGSLDAGEQDRAIRPDPGGRRKVILATSIAETSLTIDGVRIVVDGGYARVPRFSPRTGMTRLETVRVTRAGAAQRAGRAGRQAPGTCWRLWPEAEQAGLVPFQQPEILEADLAPLALALADAGVADAATLRWLDPPPAPTLAQARELLRELGALDAAGRITPHGRELLALGTHPRLAHLLLRGRALGLGTLACRLAALLGERDILQGEGVPPDADVSLRLEALAGRTPPPSVHGFTVRRDAAFRVRDEAEALARDLGLGRGGDAPADPADAGRLLALAYPDRVAARREGAAGRYLLRNGRGAAFPTRQALAESAWIVAAELDGAGAESRILLAAAVELEAILEAFGDQVTREDEVRWDDAAGTVRARRVERLGALVLREGALAEPDPARVAAALADGIRGRGLAALPWGEGAARLRERIAFLRALDAAWPDWSDAALLASLDEWLVPRLAGMRKLADLARLDLGALLLDRLDWRQRGRLDELAPTHVTVPSGSRLPVDYADPRAPVLAVRLQEMFGATDTPRVGGGRVPLTLHLLSPAHRPVQVTQDLAGFWRTSYFDVRKDLRGRYPKHPWPDDPLAEAPTRRAKPRPRE